MELEREPDGVKITPLPVSVMRFYNDALYVPNLGASERELIQRLQKYNARFHQTYNPNSISVFTCQRNLAIWTCIAMILEHRVAMNPLCRPWEVVNIVE